MKASSCKEDPSTPPLKVLGRLHEFYTSGLFLSTLVTTLAVVFLHHSFIFNTSLFSRLTLASNAIQLGGDLILKLSARLLHFRAN